MNANDDAFDQWCRDQGEHVTDADGVVREVGTKYAPARAACDQCQDRPASVLHGVVALCGRCAFEELLAQTDEVDG